MQTKRDKFANSADPDWPVCTFRLTSQFATGVLSKFKDREQSTKTTDITKTYLYNFDPLKPHFYIVKLGFTGVNVFFFISTQKHRLWVLVVPTIYVLSRNNNNKKKKKKKKIAEFLYENFRFLVVKFSIHLNKRVFVMVNTVELELFDSYNQTVHWSYLVIQRLALVLLNILRCLAHF